MNNRDIIKVLRAGKTIFAGGVLKTLLLALLCVTAATGGLNAQNAGNAASMRNSGIARNSGSAGGARNGGNVRAAANPSDKTVTLSDRELTVAEAFSQTEVQAGVIIVANLDKFDMRRVISFGSLTNTVDQILDRAVAGTGFGYRFSGRYIMIVPSDAASVDAKPAASVTPAPAITYSATYDYQRPVRRQAAGEDYEPQTTVEVRRETTLVEVPHDGLFSYGSVKLGLTGDRRRTDVADVRGLYRALRFAIKTNLLHDATLTLNLGAEIGLGPKSTLEFVGAINRRNLKGDQSDNKKLTHWILKPEYRYWFCERFNGHFLGVHALYAQYNVGGYNIPLLFDKKYRYEGDAWGAGISYGYHWILGRSWGLEFNAGVGVAAMKYTKKDAAKCGGFVGDYDKIYFGPTSLGIKLVFVIR